MNRVIAIDPGHKKCGLLLADLRLNSVIDGKVVDEDEVINLINIWKKDPSFDKIFIGNGTSCENWLALLKDIAPIQLVEERGTTLRARERYWEIWPPNTLIDLLPRSLLFPPKYLDAVAALVLLEDHLKIKLFWEGLPNFRIQHEP